MSREIQLQALKGLYRIRDGNAAASNQLYAQLSDLLAFQRYESIARGFQRPDVSLEPFVRSLRSSNTVENATAVLVLIGGLRAAKVMVDSLIDWHRLDNDSWSFLRRALMTIGKDATEALRPWLRRDDAIVQWRAATLLSDIGYSPRDKAERVQITALTESWSVAKDLGPAALPTLAAIVRSGSFEGRYKAVRAIEAIAARESEAVDILLQARMQKNVFAGSTFPLLVRWRAGEAIEAAGSVAIPILRKAAGSADSRLRREAIRALGRIRVAPSDEIVAALSDADEMVRCEAALALGRLRDPSAVDALLAAMERVDSGLKCNLVWSLGEIGDPRAADCLSTAAEDPDPDVRQAAAIALRKLQERALSPVD